jgi:hypothetical protein
MKCGTISIGVSAEQRLQNQAKVASLRSVDERVTALIGTVESLVATAEPDAATFDRKLRQRKGKRAWCAEAKTMQATAAKLRRELESQDV